MNRTRNVTLFALPGIAFCLASVAQAAKIESFAIKQGIPGDQLPEYHLVWQDSASRWKPEPDDEVLVVFEYGITMNGAQALAKDAKISVKLDNMVAEATVKLSGDGKRQSGRIDLRRAGSGAANYPRECAI